MLHPDAAAWSPHIGACSTPEDGGRMSSGGPIRKAHDQRTFSTTPVMMSRLCPEVNISQDLDLQAACPEAFTCRIGIHFCFVDSFIAMLNGQSKGTLSAAEAQQVTPTTLGTCPDVISSIRTGHLRRSSQSRWPPAARCAPAPARASAWQCAARSTCMRSQTFFNTAAAA